MKSKTRASAPRCMACRYAAIGAAVCALAGTFAYAGGWLTPSRLTTYRIINQFQRDNGTHPGYRRNHAKGLCVEGYFDSSGNASSISRAQVFQPGRTPVIGRFAIPGGNPSAPDASVPVRSMALLFTQRDGEQWRTAMNSTPVFAVRTPEQFYRQLVAAQPDPNTGKPDPAKLKAFMQPIRKHGHFRNGSKRIPRRQVSRMPRTTASTHFASSTRAATSMPCVGPSNLKRRMHPSIRKKRATPTFCRSNWKRSSHTVACVGTCS
jgi:hypothetical protein